MPNSAGWTEPGNQDQWNVIQHFELDVMSEETIRKAALAVTDYAAYNLWEHGETLEILEALGLEPAPVEGK